MWLPASPTGSCRGGRFFFEEVCGPLRVAPPSPSHRSMDFWEGFLGEVITASARLDHAETKASDTSGGKFLDRLYPLAARPDVFTDFFDCFIGVGQCDVS